MRSDEELLKAREAFKAETDRMERQSTLDVRVDATNAAAWTDLGQCYSRRGQWERADECYQRALRLAPLQPYANFNRSFSLMYEGRWQEAWACFEHRRYLAVGGVRFDPCSEWDGKKQVPSLLVWGEQGIGDVIQWARDIPYALCPHVTVEVPNCMVRLMPRFKRVSDVWARPKDMSVPYPVPEYHAPLGSLAHKLGAARCQVNTPYLNVPADPAHKGKVFYCHAGSAAHQNDAQRSSTEAEASVLKDAGFERFHYGDPACGVDFYDAATALAGCKALITVDTAVAHLAGALGVRTWLVPPLNGEGRWGSDPNGKNDLYGSVKVVHNEEGFAEAFAFARDEVDAL